MVPMIEPDFSEIAEITPGEYHVNIIEAALKDTQKGEKMIKWTLSVVNNADPKLNGKLIWTNTMTSGAGAFRLKQFVEAALGSYDRWNKDTDQLLGRTVSVVVVEGIDKRDGTKTGFAEVKAVKAVS